MRNLRSIHVISGAAIALALAACASTAPQTQWANEAYTKKLASQRVMVVASAEREDVRQLFEDQLVAQLRAQGVNAIASYHYVTRLGLAPIEQVKQTMRTNGIQAVLEARVEQTPTKGDLEANTFFAYLYAGYYTTVYPPNAPSQYFSTTYSTGSRLYDLADDVTIWSGTLKLSGTNDIYNRPRKIAEEYAKRVVQSLSDKRFLS